MSLLHYHFFIYLESGTCLYKITKENTLETSMNGILQALYFTTSDYKFKVKSICSETALLGYKLYSNKNSNLLFCLILPNSFGSEDLAQLILERTLDYTYYAMIMHIGLTDLFTYKTPQDIDSLKKMIELYEPTLKFIIENHNKLDLILKSERKVEVSRDVLYPIKYYFNSLKTKVKSDYICICINDVLLWANSDWLNLDIIDRILIKIIVKLYGQEDVSEIPFYFAKTPLEDDMTGKVAYKVFFSRLYGKYNLLILGEDNFNIELIYEKILASEIDSFFQNKIENFKYNLEIEPKFIDNLAKSILIQNNSLKTYKIMINENFSQIYIDFLLNCHFSLHCLGKTSNVDEFYVKNEEYLFFYLNVGQMNIYMIFDQSTSFEDIYNIKKHFKTLKDQIDNKENFENIEK